MRYLMIILVVGLIAKDTSQLRDPYLIRGLVQCSALVAGVLWFIGNLTGTLLARYSWMFLYMAVLLISAFVASNVTFVFLQAVSVCAVFIFAIAYWEVAHEKRVERMGTLIWAVAIAYMIVMIISLTLRQVAPQIAYDYVNAGNIAGTELRFRGLFAKPAMMGSASGLAIGAAWFCFRRVWLRLVCASPAVMCLALTQSRTFWVAALVAGIVTTYFYATAASRRRLLWAVAILTPLVIGVITTLEIRRAEIDRASEIVRADSVQNLSGRVALWRHAVEGALQRPILGYGLTFGAEGLEDRHRRLDGRAGGEARSISSTSLHNGYMQAMLDSGICGAILYAGIIAIAIYRTVRLDKTRSFPALLYFLVFLGTANSGESVIYSASVFHSVLFWICAAMAFSLKRPEATGNVSRVPLTLGRYVS